MMHKSGHGSDHLSRDTDRPIGKGVHADKLVSNRPGPDHRTGNAATDGFTHVETVPLHGSKITKRVPHGRG